MGDCRCQHQTSDRHRLQLTPVQGPVPTILCMVCDGYNDLAMIFTGSLRRGSHPVCEDGTTWLQTTFSSSLVLDLMGCRLGDIKRHGSSFLTLGWFFGWLVHIGQSGQNHPRSATGDLCSARSFYRCEQDALEAREQRLRDGLESNLQKMAERIRWPHSSLADWPLLPGWKQGTNFFRPSSDPLPKPRRHVGW